MDLNLRSIHQTSSGLLSEIIRLNCLLIQSILFNFYRKLVLLLRILGQVRAAANTQLVDSVSGLGERERLVKDAWKWLLHIPFDERALPFCFQFSIAGHGKETATILLANKIRILNPLIKVLLLPKRDAITGPHILLQIKTANFETLHIAAFLRRLSQLVLAHVCEVVVIIIIYL